MTTPVTKIEKVDQFAISYMFLVSLLPTYTDWVSAVRQRYHEYVDVSFTTYIEAKTFSAAAALLEETITMSFIENYRMRKKFLRACTYRDLDTDQLACLKHLNLWHKLFQSEEISVRLM
jgi:hypothetical protein